MNKSQITEIVGEVITKAAKAKGWSLAQLTRQLGKGENTLHRWRTGATTTYDFEAMVKLFKMAGMSMDAVFGLTAGKEEGRSISERQYEMLNKEISRIKYDLDLVKPVANLMRAIAVTAASVGDGVEEEAQLAARAKASYDSETLKRSRGKAISLGEKLTGGSGTKGKEGERGA